jgi:hypothetical protein
MLSLAPEQLTTCDLDALIAQAELLKQHHRDTFTSPFPKAPSRWLSHDHLRPQAMTFTSQGDVDGSGLPLPLWPQQGRALAPRGAARTLLGALHGLPLRR